MMKDELDIRLLFNLSESRSVAVIDKSIIGECDFTNRGKEWVITHTFVDEKYGGRGIARKLVECVIEEARKKGVKIVPVCSYAKKMMEEGNYKDILKL